MSVYLRDFFMCMYWGHIYVCVCKCIRTGGMYMCYDGCLCVGISVFVCMLMLHMHI